jgi:Protein of unknown function (DUF2628)
VRIWTTHEKPRAAPVLVREGFSFGALLFGPLWLAARRAWIPAGLTLAVSVAILILTGPPTSIVLIAAVALLLGLFGRDLVRWTLALRGYTETHVIAGRTEDDARLRLFEARPDLLEREMVAEGAP